MIESMFDDSPDPDRSSALLETMGAARRAEAAAVAARLDAIGELFELRRVQRGEEPEWAVDTWAAVVAEVAATLRTSRAMASSYLRYALAMRERLPHVAAALRAGDIGYEVFQTIVFRTDLINDEKILARVDEQLAAAVPRWPSMSRGRLTHAIDRIVAVCDPDALRRAREQASSRAVSIYDTESGISEVSGRLFTTDAHVLDRRLDALIATVCCNDPRTRNQRRADALGALAAGADTMACRCERGDCAAGKPPASAVVIHVVAEEAALEGRSAAPAVVLGSDWLVPAEVIAELAKTARQRPLIHPADAPPEPHYRPSAALAAYVRARDLTCRAPGCDVAASECDIDHVIPWSQGGLTHASNLSCKCSGHHLLKTFWGWRDRQLPDATLIWTLPSGHTHVTTPGSALLFPTLCAPTGDLPPPHPPQDRCGLRSTMMPLRASTRAQNRARYIAAERDRNHQARAATVAQPADGSPPPDPDDEPPPF
jgi:Domain of unknown function (DUF222)